MERLSDRAIEIINDLHRDCLNYESEYLPLIDCAQQCAAYEDTMPLERAQEMAQDEKAGRLVVLGGRCKDCSHWVPPHIEKDGKFVRELKPGELVSLREGVNFGSYCSRVDDVLVHGLREGEPSSEKTNAWMRADDFCSKFERKETE